MNEQVCTKAVDTCGYPVETTGNAVLDILEHRSSTRAFARDDDDRPVAVTDEQRAAILHAASRAPSAGAMMMYSIVSIREQATLDRLADLCDHQPMIAKVPWALIFVVDYAKWIDLFEHVGCFEPEFVERTGKAPRRAPGLGDFAIAAQDAVIAAQNAVVAAEALRRAAPRDEIVMVAGTPPIRATKARYFEDARFMERILTPPDPAAFAPAH